MSGDTLLRTFPTTKLQKNAPRGWAEMMSPTVYSFIPLFSANGGKKGTISDIDRHIMNEQSKSM